MNLDKERIVRPKALQFGDTIGIVAPAGPFQNNRFKAGIAAIHKMGFDTKFDDGIFEGHSYLAGGDHHRAAQFNTMVADESVQAVICARGGYGAMRILDALDYDAISNHSKPIIGFSDITAIHRAIYLKTGMVTFHGPMVTTLARSDKASLQSFHDVLRGDLASSVGISALRILKPGVAEGILTGGNLATLCHLVGTSYGADFSGTILLIEDVGEAPYRIDRMLTQMKMSGILNGIKGLVAGTFKNCGAADEIDAVISERFQDMDIPIVSRVSIGHGRCNLTVPLGGRVLLDTQEPVLCFLEPVLDKDQEH